MTPSTKGLILVGSTIALSVLGLAMRRWASDAPSADAAPRPSTGGRAAPGFGRMALPERQWIPGTTYVYEIESARTVAMQTDEGAGAPKALALSGRLSISVVGPAEDGHLLRLALDELHADRASAALAGDPARLAGAFYAVAEPSGKWRSFSFPRGTGSAARGTLKGLASALQLVVPDPAADAWRTLEQDASGEYEAAYRTEGGGLHKAKERFVRARRARGLAPIEDPSAFAVASSIELQLDASGWPRSVSEDETLSVKAGPMKVEAKTRTRARLASIEPSPELARIAAAEQGALEPEPEIDAEGFAATRRRADEDLLDGAGYGALLADLTAADTKVRNRAMARLASLFRLHPQEAARAVASVLRGETAGETTKRVLGALGSAGTKEAQQALAQVLDAAAAASATRRSAASSLGLTKQPTEDSKRALAKAAGSSDAGLAGAATLGLGNLVKRMNEQGSGDPSDAIAMLIERLAAATDDAERLLCLDALGNAGDPRALSAIAPYLAHADVKLRATAVEALRFMAGTDGQIAAALQDGAAAVRRAAAGALAYRAITPMLQLVTLLVQHDPDAGTRLELVSALKLRVRQEPGLASLLAWAAANDPSADVRSAAQSSK
jgi:hypothetical protein